MPSLKLLKSFATLAATGHFGQAADRLGMTQPALSLQIKELETRLGTQLIERRKTGLRLTAAGTALLPDIESLLRAGDDLATRARHLSGPLSGRLRLGVIPTIAPYLLPPLLPRIASTYPQLELEITESQTATLVADLRAGIIDLALLALPLGHRDMAELPLFDDPFYLVAPTDHKLSKQKDIAPQDIIDGPLLLLDEGHCLRDQALSFCRTEHGARVGQSAFRTASLSTLTELVAHGMGVTLMPKMALKREVQPHHDLKAKILPGATRTIGLIWRARHPQADDFAKIGTLIKKAH